MRRIGVNNSNNVKYPSHIWSSRQYVRGGSYEVADVKDGKGRLVGCNKHLFFFKSVKTTRLKRPRYGNMAFGSGKSTLTPRFASTNKSNT